MGEKSRIEWTGHTFNGWWGCTKISPACTHCYAASLSARYGHEVWGPKAERRILSENSWRKPLRWDAQAREAGIRTKVFCSSMADVFEERRELDPLRERLWGLIAQTPHLDWQLLTKRPQFIASMVPWQSDWPSNVWIGTTVENQVLAEERLPWLVELPAAVRFISAEPLFSELNLSPWIEHLDWVIAGGESGPKARIPSPTQFRHLRDQCVEAGVPFFFKQWGEWAPLRPRAGLSGRTAEASDGTVMQRVRKNHAGHCLDGKQWTQFPTPRSR